MKKYTINAQHIIGYKLTFEVNCDNLDTALEIFKNVIDPKQNTYKIVNYEVVEG